MYAYVHEIAHTLERGQEGRGEDGERTNRQIEEVKPPVFRDDMKTFVGESTVQRSPKHLRFPLVDKCVVCTTLCKLCLSDDDVELFHDSTAD